MSETVRPETGARPDASRAVKEDLSELRTVVLGPQLLLGFLYSALFQPGFGPLDAPRRAMTLVAYALLLVTLGLVLAPVSQHQLGAHGQRAPSVAALSRRILTAAMAPFALAIAADVFVAVPGPGGIALSVAAAGLALALWYGWEVAVKRKAPGAAKAEGRRETPLKDRVADIMTETRIALPGVQALLGFQLAAYLSNAFPKLPAPVVAAHSLALAALLVSMILLMTPAPFHRIAERGEDSERLCRVGAVVILLAMAALGVGLAADFYVACAIVAGPGPLALAAAAAAVILLAGLWFALPLLLRARPPAAMGRRAPRGQRRASHA